ncbi:DUF309 domain-containing protein [Limnochorda pilosa]|uniref:DUF309 domain-containing protein n=1 Tax=Limnochorda pilosa TaxID=1555112 RepID=A0A0K2SJZ2_LIMPI|nr:DUF309 domain-containing protein [Limnochorda pilosa]BAS27332.1 hypothetical protein LIP_1483 [Limnochorda pilosa]
MSGASRFQAEFLRFLELFNQELFWESHEVLEGAWRRNRSPFYQGLIIYASAFVHAQRANPAGVVKQMAKARTRLEPYRPHHLGLDVEEILHQASRWTRLAQQALAGPGLSPLEPPPPFPRLSPDPGLIRGDEPELPP